MTICQEQRAFNYANFHHAGQVRKYTGEPYIHHPAMVVRILKGVGVLHLPTLCAAWMHDVLEDCMQHLTPEQRIADMRTQFDEDETVSLVIGMTNTTTLADGNREVRMGMECIRLAAQNQYVQSIKLADSIHNLLSILQYHKFNPYAVTVANEKLQLLKALQLGHPALLDRLGTMLSRYFNLDEIPQDNKYVA